MKSVEQQALQALHRARTQWQAARTARINVLRGLLREQGHPMPLGTRTVLARVIAVLDTARDTRPGLLQTLIRTLVDEVRDLEATAG